MLTKKIFSHILDIGEQMLISGAEVNRVEDSISRMCKAYDISRVDVFTITSSIVVTAQMDSSDTMTQTRRIIRYTTNLEKLDQLNSLSRNICDQTPDADYIQKELKKIEEIKIYKPYIHYLIYALIASAFTVFFGGDLNDALVSALIGVILKLTVTLAQKIDKNVVIANIICPFAVGILAVLAVKSGIGHSAEKIMIGNIMLMIPGVALTNSIRDIISGDTIAGLLRLTEATIIALSIAIGFGLSSLIFGGSIL